MKWVEIDQHVINLEKVQRVFFDTPARTVKFVFGPKDDLVFNMTSENKYKQILNKIKELTQ